MPQMAPSWWLTLMIMLIIILIIFNTLLYFMSHYTLMHKNNLIKLNMGWKW